MTQVPLPVPVDTSPFDAIMRVDEHGQHWTGRDLMPLLGYDKWERFDNAVERAINAIANTDDDPAQHTTYETETRGRQSTTTARLTPKGWGYAWDRAVARIAETGSLKPSRALEMSS